MPRKEPAPVVINCITFAAVQTSLDAKVVVESSYRLTINNRTDDLEIIRGLRDICNWLIELREAPTCSEKQE